MWKRRRKVEPEATPVTGGTPAGARPPPGVEDRLRDLAAALPTAGAREWLRFEAEVRATAFAPAWSAALRARIEAGTATPEQVLLAACHHDGRLREAAVRVSTDVRVAALRSTDWVPQVRDLARARCRAAVADALPAIARFAWAVHGRTRGRWLVDTVEAVLSTAPAEVAAAARAVDEPRARRTAFRATAAALSLPELLRAARTDHDQAVRLICGAAACRAAKDAGDVDALRPLLSARTSALRADTVHTLALAGDLRPALDALTDRTAIVRATAQAALRRAGEDPADRYRALLPHTAESAAGRGEPGGRGDADALLPLLSAPGPRTRAAAVTALHALGVATPELVGPLLADSSPRVGTSAARALRDRPPSEAFLHDLLDRGRPPHARAAAYSLLRARSAACRLRTDLILLADDVLPAADRAVDADPLRARAAKDVSDWARNQYLPSTSADDTPWAALITGAERALGPELARLLRLALGLRP